MINVDDMPSETFVPGPLPFVYHSRFLSGALFHSIVKMVNIFSLSGFPSVWIPDIIGFWQWQSVSSSQCAALETSQILRGDHGRYLDESWKFVIRRIEHWKSARIFWMALISFRPRIDLLDAMQLDEQESFELTWFSKKCHVVCGVSRPLCIFWVALPDLFKTLY
jgi:hypothetical protein